LTYQANSDLRVPNFVTLLLIIPKRLTVQTKSDSEVPDLDIDTKASSIYIGITESFSKTLDLLNTYLKIFMNAIFLADDSVSQFCTSIFGKMVMAGYTMTIIKKR